MVSQNAFKHSNAFACTSLLMFPDKFPAKGRDLVREKRERNCYQENPVSKKEHLNERADAEEISPNINDPERRD